MKKVTVIGGGTGTFVVLSGIKKLDLDLSAIVTMMDSGGSTGKLRDQLGVLPPGDLRQCLVALSEASDLWRKLFLYRFEQGDFIGHNFGNVFLSALEKVSPNYQEVIDTASFVLRTKGKVMPVTFEKTHLCVEYENGIILKGEGEIDENHAETSRIKRAFIDPIVSPNPKTISTIEQSNLIIIGPGDLYTSIIPVLLVPGIAQALQQTKATIVYVMNLMTKSGQTSGFSALDHCNDLTKYMGKAPDAIVVNDGIIQPDILQWYTNHHEKPVINDLVSGFTGRIVEGDIVDSSLVVKNKTDILTRSILRHDSDKLVSVLQKAFNL